MFCSASARGDLATRTIPSVPSPARYCLADLQPFHRHWRAVQFEVFRPSQVVRVPFAELTARASPSRASAVPGSLRPVAVRAGYSNRRAHIPLDVLFQRPMAGLAQLLEQFLPSRQVVVAPAVRPRAQRIVPAPAGSCWGVEAFRRADLVRVLAADPRSPRSHGAARAPVRLGSFAIAV
jgi:hypothetical protein